MKTGHLNCKDKLILQNRISPGFQIAALFFAGRLILFSSISYSGLTAYTDYWNFFYQAGLGLPFLDYWTEFPPIFPYLSRMVFFLSGGSEHAYGYLVAGMMTLFQAGSIALMYELGLMTGLGQKCSVKRTGIFSLLIAGLFYGWGYFDPVAIFLMLLGIYVAQRRKSSIAGLMLGLGGLTKWFPLLVLPALLKNKARRNSVRILVWGVILMLVVWISLYGISPAFTWSSIQAQFVKGSWETIYALFDGNLSTGNFGANFNRLEPLGNQGGQYGPTFNYSSWVALLLIGGGGVYLWWRTALETFQQTLGFAGLTITMFFVWSPGYSPQWILYFLPIIMIVFPLKESVLWSILLILISLLEWPLLLSRGLFHNLYWLVPLRTILFVLLGYKFFQQAINDTDDYSTEMGISR